MPDELPRPRKRHRRIGLNRKRILENAAAKRAAKAEKRVARETAIAARHEAQRLQAEQEAAALAAKKAELQAMMDAERKRVLNEKRPPNVAEFCRMNGLPEDTVYHPRYNAVGVDPATSEQALECICFGRAWPSEMGGLGPYGHLKRFIEMTWPDIAFNPWLERCLKSLCDVEWETAHRSGVRTRYVSWVGAGSAGKTFAAGLFAAVWFIYDQACCRKPRTSITLTSTSKGIIAQRVWPVIQKLYHEAQYYPSTNKFRWAHMIDSQKQVQAVKGDAKHSICAMAVESGDLQECLNRIKGRHTERMMLIVDEANTTPQAIFEAIPNMQTSAKELIVLVIGNAGGRLDAHGRCCEPLKGWKSITIEDDIWPTKGVQQWGIGKGVCLHFDGARSPNVLAGRTEHKHIYSFERWQQVVRMGEEYRNTLQHWSQDRGFWPPDGISTTIFSEAMVMVHDGQGKFDWLSPPRPCAALDPAFGGDDCVFQLGLVGDVRGPRRALQLTESVLVPFNPESPDPIDAQMAKWVIARCAKEGVVPELFGLDATATGRGMSALIQQFWSPRIVGVEFGGAASDLPASREDPRASNEVYANRVTELWYVCRELLVSEQLKGLSDVAIKEFCSRVYEFMSRRYKVEPKSDMKARLGSSPDHADAVVVLVETCRRNAGLTVNGVASRGSRSVRNEWSQVANDIADTLQIGYGERDTFSTYIDV